MNRPPICGKQLLHRLTDCRPFLLKIMVNLSPFGNIPERGPDSPIGYTWQRNTGWRIFILIDDWFDIPNWESSESNDMPSAHAYGLALLRDKLSELKSTRAIGFFSLPDPQSTDFKGDIQRLIDSIVEWILSVKDVDSRSYVMVDYYYGEGFSSAQEAGSHIVNQWKEQEGTIYEKLGISTALSHISIGGARSNQYDLEVFSKTDMYSTQSLSKSLRAWLDIDEHPVLRLWQKSHHWFLASHSEEDVMKHTAANIQEYLDSPEDGRIEMYRNNIESALGVVLPDVWWQSTESVGFMHESLKCLCGAMFCGQCNEEALKRPLSTGAVFFVAMLAHQHQCGNIDPFIANEKTWTGCHNVATSFVFPKQACETAKSSTLALYDLFRLLFEVKTKLEGESETKTSQVNSVFFGDKGRFVRIELAWNAHRKEVNSAGSLSERISQLLIDTPISITKKQPANTREAILKVWQLMAINEEGVFSPGIVQLNKNLLIVGSVM